MIVPNFSGNSITNGTRAGAHRCSTVSVMAGYDNLSPRRQDAKNTILVRIAQFLGFLAGTILDPSHRIVRRFPRFTRARQFSQGGIEAELQALLNAQHHSAATHLKAPGDRFVALAGQGVQQDSARCVRRFPRIVTAQSTRVCGSPPQKTAGQNAFSESPCPLKHFCLIMYSYLENDNLVFVIAGLISEGIGSGSLVCGAYYASPRCSDSNGSISILRAARF